MQHLSLKHGYIFQLLWTVINYSWLKEHRIRVSVTQNVMCKSPLIFVLLFNQRQLLILELHERNVHMTTDQKSLPEDEKTSFTRSSSRIIITIISINSHYSWPQHDSSRQCLQDYTSANTTDNITNYSTTLLIEVKKIPIKWQIMRKPSCCVSTVI